MNKTLSLLAALALSTTVAFAQSDILVGDMNDDGQLSIGDITALTDAVLEPQKQRTISTKCDPNASDPAVIAGSWRAVDKSTLTLTAEGRATVSGNSAVTQFEYFPFSRDLVLLNAGGYVVQDFHVLRLAKDYLVFRLTDGTYATYYPSDRYATSLTLGDNKLSLRTGETHQLSVEPTPPGTIMPAITWESSDTSVATVTADGLVTAVKGGTCTITATAQDDTKVSVSCTVSVVQLVESITLSRTSLLLDLGETLKLTATVLPADANDLTFTWSSSNEDVAEVSRDGNVTANGYGIAFITATANDGSGVKATCSVTVAKPHEYVDLGLPSGTRWATCNVGADKPEDYGYYFAWGEIEPKSTYNWSTYKWMKEGYSDWKGCSKYTAKDGQTSCCWYNNGTFIGDNKTVLNFEDDAAYMNWGGGWRMPSLEQLQELFNSNYTTTQWTTQNGKNGRLITSKQNGCSLFLPAAGYRSDGSLSIAGSDGYYWSRSLRTNYSYTAYGLRFDSGYIDWGYYRYYGFSVRPVRE